MMTQVLRSGPAVYTVVAEWAEHATTQRLATWALAGALGASVALGLAPGWWWLGAMPLICIACAAAWGLAHRTRAGSPRARIALSFAQRAAGVVGTLAFVVGFYGFLLWILGRPWML